MVVFASIHGDVKSPMELVVVPERTEALSVQALRSCHARFGNRKRLGVTWGREFRGDRRGGAAECRELFVYASRKNWQSSERGYDSVLRPGSPCVTRPAFYAAPLRRWLPSPRDPLQRL